MVYEEPQTFEADNGAAIATALLIVLSFLLGAIIFIDVITYLHVARRILATNIGHIFPILIPKPVNNLFRCFLFVLLIIFLIIFLNIWHLE